ncbi:hypothetical protein FEM48_Zijuj01G0000100 [Ziziphus jujuba var. spinosa]|uniref:Uncharacterized protein n=1 Tax=Ziziphus jujuba var. spinosa TaxID=714518 RepID=A0A978VXY8_ZIZJJ|nr:hypothetical protein FEM48_Zijuj01G0000100 [Ziziphus jujuba var. spinosa]
MDPINIDEDSIETPTKVGATTNNTKSIEETDMKKKTKGLYVGKGEKRKLRSPAWNLIELCHLVRIKRNILSVIIKHELPFNLVEYEGIRPIFSYVSANLKMPCRNAVKACMLRMFKTEKQKLHKLLDSVQARKGSDSFLRKMGTYMNLKFEKMLVRL